MNRLHRCNIGKSLYHILFSTQINYQGELIKNLTSQIHQLTEKMVNLSQATEHHHQRVCRTHLFKLHF